MRPQIGTLAATFWRPAAAAVRSSPQLAGYLSLTALTTLVVLVVNLMGGIVQARGLGPEGRGELTIAMLWPSLITGLGGLGLTESIAYHTAREGSGRSRVLATAMVIAVPQMLALLLLGWSLLPIVLHGKPPQLLSQTRFYLLWFLPLFPLLFYTQAYLQGRLAIGSLNALFLCTSAVSTALVAVLWVSHTLTVHSALVAMLASWAIATALGIGILFMRRDVSWRANPGLVRPLLWFGLRRHIGHMAVLVLQQRLDLIVLSVVIPAAAVGTYAVATSAATVASLPIAASLFLYPRFARQTATELPFAMSRLLLTGGLLTVAASPFLLLLPPLALPYVYGHAFESARPLAAILGLGYLARGWNGLLAAVIAASGRPFTATIGQTVEFATFAPMLAILIRFGMTGAATAVLLGAATSLVCLLISALVITRLTPRRLVALWAHQIRSWRQLSVEARLTGPGGLDP